MHIPLSIFLATASIFSTVLSVPHPWTPGPSNGRIDCSTAVKGLLKADCEYMSKIGIAGQGVNSYTPNDLIWVGKQGPNIFNFENKSGVNLILIFWHYPIGDYVKMFMSAHAPQISYSLSPGQNVTISVADDVSGGWAGLYDHKTILCPESGLVQNTWGEFTTDPQYVRDANGQDFVNNGDKIVNNQGRTHVDVSKLVYMKGDKMSIRMDKKPGGCVSDFSKCYFECVGNPLTCGRQNEYRLVNCGPGSQPGANYGLKWGQPEGGCAGLERNGYVTVTL